jgi:hypothetical protein
MNKVDRSIWPLFGAVCIGIALGHLDRREPIPRVIERQLQPIVITVYGQRPEEIKKTVDLLLKQRPILEGFKK